MKNRIISLLIASSMILTLAGCGNNDLEDENRRLQEQIDALQQGENGGTTLTDSVEIDSATPEVVAERYLNAYFEGDFATYSKYSAMDLDVLWAGFLPFMENVDGFTGHQTTMETFFETITETDFGETIFNVADVHYMSQSEKNEHISMLKHTTQDFNNFANINIDVDKIILLADIQEMCRVTTVGSGEGQGAFEIYCVKINDRWLVFQDMIVFTAIERLDYEEPSMSTTAPIELVEHRCTFDCNEFVAISNQQICILTTDPLTVKMGSSYVGSIGGGMGRAVYNYDELNKVPQFVNLRSLTISVSQAQQNHEGVDLTVLKEMTNLTSLTLQRTSAIAFFNFTLFTDLTPLSGLTNLTYLDIDYCVDITWLSNLTNLTHLTLQNIKSDDLTPLKELTNLTQLELGGEAIDDITPISELTKLTHLVLHGKTSDISSLANLTNLVFVDFYCSNIPQGHINALKDALPHAEIRLRGTVQ
jgi:hypothetical protein